MKIETSYFGEVEIEEKDILSFPRGILAFEEYNKFIIINNEEEELPFKWLQSIDEKEVSFIMIDPFLFKKDYEVDLKDQLIEELKIEKESDIAIYTLLVIPEQVDQMTANLIGPIVINVEKNLGTQVVLEDKRYHTRHKIIDEVKKGD